MDLGPQDGIADLGHGTDQSRAGRRVVAFPREIAPELRWHLERFVEPGPSSRVFVGPKGGRLRRSNFRLIWNKTRDEAGLPGLHLHDLRHTGNAMAAAVGASLRELMERMGHSSPHAALIYQHASREGTRRSSRPWGSCSPRPGGRARRRADRARNGHDGRAACLDLGSRWRRYRR
jgi:integrase